VRFKHLTVQDRLAIYDRTGMPKNHRKATLDLIPKFKYKKKVIGYIEDIDMQIKNGKGLFLYGPYSAGKSAIAALCIKAAVNFGHVGYWIRAMDLTSDKIEGTMFDEFITRYERCLEVPILVIDEMILRKKAAYSEILLEEVVRSRVDSEQVTILTTNHTLAEFRERHPALVAVLDEAVWYVEVKGWDHRKGTEALETTKPRTDSDGTSNLW
jgi:DNA replication protein DnaC